MWHQMEIESVLRTLHTNIKFGLSEEEANRRLAQYGKNKLKEGKKTSFFIKFISQFKDFMIIILIISSIISAAVAYLEHSNDYIDSIIILIIVFLNSLMGVIQESKAEKSIEALQKLSSPHTKVRRNGTIKIIESENVVPGDIVIIETGSYIPADMRLIESFNLKVEESALTGETVAVDKNANKILVGNIPLGDIENMCFATTIAVSRARRRNSYRKWNEYKSWKNCKYDYNR